MPVGILRYYIKTPTWFKVKQLTDMFTIFTNDTNFINNIKFVKSVIIISVTIIDLLWHYFLYHSFKINFKPQYRHKLLGFQRKVNE
ncbi:hypothetical protein D6D98_03215 [Moraxella catarrhalis]|nr:hypothetical protein [Moraxella catarrhalis]MPW95665.1 hypothetical protein [Moraxella catarrhalis]MPX22248.1 hypothetical protein [Moraxella catarrhalis]MPX75986.1 hypothetical protein [Moraxella catarrhalis]RKM24971.1 hypothetical protein D6D95_03200 [Moraxella catarrhalis]